MNIRPAVPHDAVAISQLNDQSLGYPLAVEQTRKILEELVNSPRDLILVAEDHQIIGLIHGELYQTLYKPLMTNILGLAVASSAQGKGVGTALLQAFEDWSRQKGAVAIRLNSGAERQLAHRFYQKNGYQQIKLQANFRKELAE